MKTDLQNSALSAAPWEGPELHANGQAPSLQKRLAELVELTEQKRGLEAQLRTVQDRLTAIEPDLLEDMALGGMTSATVNGFTVYRQREFFARAKEGVSKDLLLDRLREAGLTNCIGLQHQTLRALAKEWADLGEGPPATVAELVDLGDVFRLRARKA